MKREISRDRKLPAVEIGIAELEALLLRIKPLFDGTDDFYLDITIRLPNERL
jgi:hypothetical protein